MCACPQEEQFGRVREMSGKTGVVARAREKSAE